MKRLFFLLLCVCAQRAFAEQVDIIPLPNRSTRVNARFALSNGTALTINDKSLKSTAWYLQTELLKVSGFAIPLKDEKGRHTLIRLNKNKKDEHGLQGYAISMDQHVVTVSAATDEGVFNGVVSLLQLFQKAGTVNGAVSVQCWNIVDKPLYGWRGLMLDESRHFFGKEKVKSIIDWMAYYKLNRFHWHLTDQNGWRLEIKKYPLLTLVGGIGNYTNKFAKAAYYTQDDIKEVVAYAAVRFIEVIPEIDMPGHARASNMAYPEFSGGGTDKHPEFTFDPGNQGTYSYLSNILKEVNVLFPSGYLHLGGDEVHFGNKEWSTNKGIATLMKQMRLNSLPAVEQYFVSRMADTVKAMGSKVLLWDEAVSEKLSKDQTIFLWWRHNKPEQLNRALSLGFEAVLCPRLPLYFDFVQDSTHRSGRRWNGQFSRLEDVYAYSHEREIRSESHARLIKGIQANLWTETVHNEQRLDFMLFPRISALAEAAWTLPANRNFGLFESRLSKDVILYKRKGINMYEGKYKIEGKEFILND